MNMHCLHGSRIPKPIFFPCILATVVENHGSLKTLLWPSTASTELHLDRKQPDRTVGSRARGDLVPHLCIILCDTYGRNSSQSYIDKQLVFTS